MLKEKKESAKLSGVEVRCPNKLIKQFGETKEMRTCNALLAVVDVPAGCSAMVAIKCTKARCRQMVHHVIDG